MEENLSTDLVALENHLNGMLGRVQQNSMTLKRFQMFEGELLLLNSLAEMIEHILDGAKDFFDLDVISFCLVDEKGDISKYLEDDGYDYQKKDNLILLEDKEFLKNITGITGKPLLGRYNSNNCAVFFPQEKKPSSVAIIPLIRRNNYLGSLNLGSHEANRFIFNMATDFVDHMVSVISNCLENNLNFEAMRRTSFIDTLTGVNNRRFLEQRLGELLNCSRRNNQPLTCLFLDIDFFKKINDTYGHQAGDQVLATVAGEIKNQLRSNDVLARYGGEEFVALLINIDDDMAYQFADRICRRIKDLSIEYNDQDISLTISIGTATYHPENSAHCSRNEIAERLIHTADSALYQAKNNGRNRVECGGLVNEASRVLQSKIA